jgi:hypothetical protein
VQILEPPPIPVVDLMIDSDDEVQILEPLPVPMVDLVIDSKD